ncbi:hemerythrin domain-containing protein [Nocardioides sp.]|uniref:hemerythrin domain-containing protein n=1 Tax=Nocardioides sp. TaxID=35761 RepID=UPI0031FF19B6|nr:hypothetical protein [Nocardioides sp.]
MTTANAIDLDGPCDTRMMGIVHSALRRDLVRARILLEGRPAIDAKRRTALAEQVLWLMHALHLHHEGEDIGLYPMVLRNNPGARELVEDMDTDHHRITPAMAAVEGATLAYRDGTTGSDAGLLAALSELEAVLLPHLAREELEMMPVVSGCVTEREWRAWNEEINLKPKSTMYLAEDGHWILDNLDAEGRALVVGQVPPVPRFILVRLLGGRYNRKRAALWEGTPAESVPSLSVEAARAWVR